ncbi:MAG: hypothetical protein PHI78_04590, partial [Clostridia bacterium]|nr:hypothetical protein [Clostridia bacterium]
LTAFAACGSKTLYTYELMTGGTYVLTETDDETVGKTLKEIVAELENEFDCDFKKTTDESGTIYLIRDSGATPSEQITLSDDFLASSPYKMIDGENLVDYISRCTQLAVNKYFKTNNMENDYEFIQLKSKLTQPIYTDGTILLFYNALNKHTGKIALGYIEINVSEKNKDFIAPFFTSGLNGDLNDYSIGVECLSSLIGTAKSNSNNMTKDIDKDTIDRGNNILDAISKGKPFNEDGIIFDTTDGGLVYYKGQFYFHRVGLKDQVSYETLTPVIINIDTFDPNTLAFSFKDTNTGETLWQKFSSPTSYVSARDLYYKYTQLQK